MNLIIFDFDLTMTKFHTTNYVTQLRRSYREESLSDLVDLMLDIVGKDDLLSELFSNHCSVLKLRQLKRTNNVKFAIASYGYKIMIEKILKKFGLDDLFDQILTPQDFGLLDGADHTQALNGKNVMIIHLLGIYNIENRSNVLFFDDSSKNVNLAHRQFYIAYQVGEAGMHSQDLDGIIDYVENHNKN